MKLSRNIGFMFFALLWFSAISHAQPLNNLRLRIIENPGDTVILDTLSIIDGSLKITTANGTPLPENCYRMDNLRALLIFNHDELKKYNLSDEKFIITYRVFPFMFHQTVYHKKADFLEPDADNIYKPYIYSYADKGESVFNFGGLNKSGNISRGISFGNNQDVVVNSSLNLQLSGKLSDDVGILAAITDNNIPIQPEGNTQQIQEFDKVYIQLYSRRTRLTAGDFELTRPPSSYFLNFYKKAQGGLLTTEFDLPETRKKSKPGSMAITAGGAVSKGKYARNVLKVTEGNQGPYKLTGIHGETYIIILAGTERVYMDGNLLIRGSDNDYVIDYNQGEITFTPKNLITKDKRIVVEFEYSDRNYSRSVYYAGTDFKAKHGAVRFNFFSEQDLKNQPLQQELTERDKRILNSVGDSVWLAVVPNIDSVAFSSSEVLYKMIDTTVNGITYDSVFVYSTSPDSAHYRLGFSNVGANKGNYVQIQSAANGRVFRWVAPQDGIPRGNYEPVMLLIAPKKAQMFTLAGDYQLGKNTSANVELALSVKDENTFSAQDKYDDIGYALHFNLKNRLKLGADSVKGWYMVSGIRHEYVQQYFSPVERFRSVEFNRDWNLLAFNHRADEQNPSLTLGFENRKNQRAFYNFHSFLKGSAFQGYKHTLEGAYDIKNFFLTFDGSYLTTRTYDSRSVYYKHKTGLEKKLPWLVLGVKEEQENNRFQAKPADTLTPASFAFEVYEAYLTSHDTARTKFGVNYKRRYDRIAMHNRFVKISVADDASANLELAKNPDNLLKTTVTYRNLRSTDTLNLKDVPNNILLGRIEFLTKKFKRTVTSNTFYEMGSGLEVKKEFSYVEVPAGQGLYSWTDYNGNGIKELNEFEVAAFKDQANFIRVFTPTNHYIRAYYSQFNEVLNVDPALVWSNKKGFRKFISRFSLQLAYKAERKTTDNHLLKAYNPFQSGVGDTSLLTLNSSFRSSLFFNRSHPKFGSDVSYVDESYKSLMMNGFESRLQSKITFRFRWNITRKFMLSGEYLEGIKRNQSDYFSSRNYRISYRDIQPKFTFQQESFFRWTIMYRYAQKTNHEGTLRERSVTHNAGMEIRYNSLNKGSLMLKGNYIAVNYNAAENTPIAFEMFEGFKKGNNITWNLSYQRNLSEYLQLNLMYEGRATPGNKVVHVGSVQLRAYF